MHAPLISFVASAEADFDERFETLVGTLSGAGVRVSVEGVSEAAEARPLPWGGPLASASASLMLVSRWTDARPDVVHVADLAALPVAAAVARRFEVPVVCTLDRRWESMAPRGSGVRARVARRAGLGRLAPHVRGADRCVALNEAVRASWAALGVRTERMVLLDSGPGIPFATFFDGEPAEDRRARSRSEIGLARGELAVGVIGHAEERSALAAALMERGVEVTLLEIPRERARRRATVAASDIVVSLTPEVAHAVAVQEAMASSIPVVVTRVPGHVEIVRHGDSGVLFAAGDALGAARGVEALLSAEVRREAGSRARSLAARLFDAELAARKVLGAYDVLLGGEAPKQASMGADGRLVTGRELA